MTWSSLISFFNEVMKHRLLLTLFTVALPAPSAPVINPQIPNSATQTSLRVCWSLFSDDTVEYYELYYRPVLEDMPADGTQVPQGELLSTAAISFIE